MQNVPLIIGIAAAVLVGFWLLKKLVKLAFWAAVICAAAWLWYFKIQ
ncbi:MAG: hypothetical protein GWP04_02365 [Gammaproteobacteria bacterium]|nr:hypothetical protein [Gammaproteobacteria bacterium]